MQDIVNKIQESNEFLGKSYLKLDKNSFGNFGSIFIDVSITCTRRYCVSIDRFEHCFRMSRTTCGAVAFVTVWRRVRTTTGTSSSLTISSDSVTNLKTLFHSFSDDAQVLIGPNNA